MRSAIKVCAIAKDEGPYLADWVFHHLHFGADAVEVWVNGTEDPSMAILERIGETHAQVSVRDADALRDECRRTGAFFQYEAYALMAAAAADEGFSHVAFLDLDEYWVPRDFASSLHDFLPERRAVNVVSFPWCLDVPDAGREPFASPFAAPLRVQLDHHVKSVVRPDDRVRQYRPHTARTRAGRRLLVRDPFPLVDKRAQQWGSVIGWDVLVDSWHQVPEAFVLHAQLRSEVEYVASLRKTGQLPTDTDWRTNRDGFGARDRPVLDAELPGDRVAAYQESRARFLSTVGVDDLVAASRDLAVRRAEEVLDDVAADPSLADGLGGGLRGLVDPRLTGDRPDWDYRIEWAEDERTRDGDRLVVSGWMFSDVRNRPVELGLRGADGTVHAPLSVEWSPRPDVAAVFRSAPLECGVRAGFDAADETVGEGEIVARPVGAVTWSRRPSHRQAARPA